MTLTLVRLDAAPLLDHARRRWIDSADEKLQGDGMLRHLLNVSDSTIYRWRENGLTIEAADRAATALGLHPWEIWPEWYDLPTIDPEEN